MVPPNGLGLPWLGLACGIVATALACGSGTAGAPSNGSGGAASDGGGTSSGGTSGTSSGGTSGTSSGGTSGTSSGGTSGTSSGGTATGSSGGMATGGAGPGARLHPLYPALDLDTLPGNGGAAIGAYEPPALPATTRTVTISSTGSQAKTDLLAACATAGTAVIVPDAAGHVGVLDFGNVTDCDVTLGASVVADLVYVGHLPGPRVAPTHRIRIRGGQLGSVMVDPGSSDIVFDGVVINNAVLPPSERARAAIYLMNSGAEHVNRFAVVNSIIRMVATGPASASAGCAYLARAAQNVFFANDNVVTAGNFDSWGFRIGGGDNFIVIDSAVRVSFHKLIRMNDGPVDYVYVKGGIWMREDTALAGGPTNNDAFAQLGDLGTDHVYIHDTAVHLLSPQPVVFGASNGPGQIGKSWEARRIAWHAISASVISDARLGQAAGSCVDGATCDYGLGTHTYEYAAAPSFPANPWRDLPAFADDDPDNQPIVP